MKQMPDVIKELSDERDACISELISLSKQLDKAKGDAKGPIKEDIATCLRKIGEIHNAVIKYSITQERKENANADD